MKGAALVILEVAAPKKPPVDTPPCNQVISSQSSHGGPVLQAHRADCLVGSRKLDSFARRHDWAGNMFPGLSMFSSSDSCAMAHGETDFAHVCCSVKP